HDALDQGKGPGGQKPELGALRSPSQSLAVEARRLSWRAHCLASNSQVASATSLQIRKNYADHARSLVILPNSHIVLRQGRLARATRWLGPAPFHGSGAPHGCSIERS